jgi:hypothetical protein
MKTSNTSERRVDCWYRLELVSTLIEMVLTRNNWTWKRLVGRTTWVRRHSKQSNGTLRLCRYGLGNLEAGVLTRVVYRCEVLGSAWGLYAAADGVARDSWRMQKKSGWTNKYDGLDDRGSSDSRAWCWRYIRFDEGTSDFDDSWPLTEFIFFVVVVRPLPMTWTVQGYVMKLFGGPIDWKSRKQSTVATSTTEAELLAPSRAA